MTAVDLFLADPAATAALAQALAQTQPPMAVVHLHGDLGAGKSTLAREWLSRLERNGQLQAFPESATQEGSAGPG